MVMIIGVHDVLEDGCVSFIQFRLGARQYWISDHFPLWWRTSKTKRAPLPVHVFGCNDLDYLLAWVYTHICALAEHTTIYIYISLQVGL